MARTSNQRDFRPAEPSTGTSLFAGASAFKVNEATIVGGNMGTTVQIVVDRNDTLKPWSRRKEFARRTSRRSHSVDVHPSKASPLPPATVEHEFCEEPLAMSAERIIDSAGDQGDLEGLREGLCLRQQEVQRRERELEERMMHWEVVRQEAERSWAEHELTISKQESEVEAWMQELKLREEQLGEASLRVEERESKLRQREFQINEWELDVQEKQLRLDVRSKEVEEMQENLRASEKRVALRSKDLRSMEDDIRSRRREELRRQLGHAAGDLLKYTTIGLQNAFGRDSALGIHRILDQFDFTKIEVTNVDVDDGLQVSLAPLYDKLDKRHMEMMPDTLKVAIAGAVTALQMNHTMQRAGPFNWLVTENLLTTTSHLYPVGERTEYHEDVEIAREMRPDELSIVAQWFKALLECDGNFSGATISVFIKIPDFVVEDESRLRKRETNTLLNDAPAEKKLLDIGVLWFPGHVRRSFKNVDKDTDEAESKPLWAYEALNNSLKHYIGVTYHPREAFIKDIPDASRQIAIDIAERLFDFA